MGAPQQPQPRRGRWGPLSYLLRDGFIVCGRFQSVSAEDGGRDTFDLVFDSAPAPRGNCKTLRTRATNAPSTARGGLTTPLSRTRSTRTCGCGADFCKAGGVLIADRPAPGWICVVRGVGATTTEPPDWTGAATALPELPPPALVLETDDDCVRGELAACGEGSGAAAVGAAAGAAWGAGSGACPLAALAYPAAANAISSASPRTSSPRVLISPSRSAIQAADGSASRVPNRLGRASPSNRPTCNGNSLVLVPPYWPRTIRLRHQRINPPRTALGRAGPARGKGPARGGHPK